MQLHRHTRLDVQILLRDQKLPLVTRLWSESFLLTGSSLLSSLNRAAWLCGNNSRGTFTCQGFAEPDLYFWRNAADGEPNDNTSERRATTYGRSNPCQATTWSGCSPRKPLRDAKGRETWRTAPPRSNKSSRKPGSDQDISGQHRRQDTRTLLGRLKT